jgi:hypothetical protein
MACRDMSLTTHEIFWFLRLTFCELLVLLMSKYSVFCWIVQGRGHPKEDIWKVIPTLLM